MHDNIVNFPAPEPDPDPVTVDNPELQRCVDSLGRLSHMISSMSQMVNDWQTGVEAHEPSDVRVVIRVCDALLDALDMQLEP
jgi:hypothetical protein